MQAFLAGGFAAVTLLILPRDTAKSQLRNVGLLALYVFITAAMFGDPGAASEKLRAQVPLDGLSPGQGFSTSEYRTVLLNVLNIVVVTRSSLRFGLKVASVLFCVMLAASLSLTTTPPEQLALGLRYLLRPLYWGKTSVHVLKRTCFTLVLAVRFLSVVFDEFRNLCLGLAARGVVWENQTIGGTLSIFASLVNRMFSNLLIRCENVADALVLRGFQGTDDTELHLNGPRPQSLLFNNLLMLLILLGLAGGAIAGF